MMKVIALVSALLLVSLPVSQAACEVCESVLSRVISSVEKKTPANIEAKIDEFCNTAEGRDRKMCYYIDTVKRDVSTPAASGVPVDKICQRIAKKDAQVPSTLSLHFARFLIV